MKIVGYGEDALSLWALKHRLSALLSHLGDDSDLQGILVFLRPSFGRRGSSSFAESAVADSPQFGEFDAIVRSPRGIYLIETKWNRSSGLEGGTAVLQQKQVFRHKVFRAYVNAWPAHHPE